MKWSISPRKLVREGERGWGGGVLIVYFDSDNSYSSEFNYRECLQLLTFETIDEYLQKTKPDQLR